MKTVIFMCILFLPAVIYAEPSLQFENEIYDFGTVIQGVQLQHTFEFTNTGTEELRILQVSTA